MQMVNGEVVTVDSDGLVVGRTTLALSNATPLTTEVVVSIVDGGAVTVNRQSGSYMLRARSSTTTTAPGAQAEFDGRIVSVPGSAVGAAVVVGD